MHQSIAATLKCMHPVITPVNTMRAKRHVIAISLYKEGALAEYFGPSRSGSWERSA